MKAQKIASTKNKNIKKTGQKICMHDYKNAIRVGNIDFQCPLCGRLVDPNTWFIMNSFNFIDMGEAL
ncbi:MAG TPA: hypothetical protein VE973_00790 [Candidatus Limnocylindria bacterium]|nr:hypothetical protein [Candidatus Limnocylindria bacterium]